MTKAAFGIHDIQSAAAVVSRSSHHTPLHTSRTADDMRGCHIAFKCENFQRGGSFKFRGAYNFVASLSDRDRLRGVCAVSSGNHAQAVALVAREFKVPAAILMPEDAPIAKLTATRLYGAEIVTYDRYSQPQDEAGREFASDRKMMLVPAYDDPRIAAGAGTAMIEVIDDWTVPDVLFAPVGGGGGIAGWATVLKAYNPQAVVYAVESSASRLVNLSLRARKIIDVELSTHLADGQMLTRLGEFTFTTMCNVVDEALSVTDKQIVEAMVFLFDRMKLVTEPSGAIATAALLCSGVNIANTKVCVMVSGGNVGAARFSELLRMDLEPQDTIPSAMRTSLRFVSQRTHDQG